MVAALTSINITRHATRSTSTDLTIARAIWIHQGKDTEHFRFTGQYSNGLELSCYGTARDLKDLTKLLKEEIDYWKEYKNQFPKRSQEVKECNKDISRNKEYIKIISACLKHLGL